MNAKFRFGSLLLAVLLLCFSAVSAQGLNLSGTVLTDDGAQPLPGADVQVKGTYLGTTSDIDGGFTLNLPGRSSATLVVSFVGYRSVEVDVNSSRDNLVIRLKEDILRGSEVVVTGVASSVKRENLANAVATVSAEELLPTPAQSMESALSGKFAGVNVSQNTGAPGGGISVNLRGVSTIEGSTQPLYVIDGVIINNSATQSGIDIVTAATGAGSPTPQGQPVNRVADINPADIANVEVLKGASAAAIYGSKASNGVVIITTKKGVAGETRIDVSQQAGFSTILNKLGTRSFTAETAEASFGETGRTLFEANGGQFIDQEEVLYGEEGFLNNTAVSIRGGSEKTTFYVSGLYQDEEGIILNTGYNKISGNVTLNHQVNDRLSIDVASKILRTKSDRGITGNDNTNTTFGFSLAATPSFLNLEPVNGVYPNHPFNPSNPVQTRDLLQNEETVNRTINSAKIKFNLMRTDNQNLDFIYQAGFDYYSQYNFVFSPPELQFEQNSDQPGTSLNGDTRGFNQNHYFNFSHLFSTESKILFRTTAGVQVENFELDNTLVQANAVTVTQTNVDQAGSINVYQDRTQQYDEGFYVQEEIDFKGTLFLTGSVRADRSSAHGDVEKFYYYPKASGSLRLSELSEGIKGFADELKIRAAFGQTGNSPAPFAKYVSLNAANIGGISGVLFNNRRGNPDIKPEQTTEIEVGIDGTFGGGRANVELTYYNQNITDLLITPSLPPSSGFLEEFVNGGEMKTQGVEVSLGVVPISKDNMRWTSRFNFYKTSSEITKLLVDPFNIGGFATFLGTYRIQEGWSPTAIVGSERNADGSFVEIGNETPDFEIGFNNRFQIGDFEIGGHLHWKKGGDIINLGKLITDLSGTTPDFDSGGPNERLGALGSETAPYVEDGSYIKLREAFITYTLSADAVESIFGGGMKYLKLGVSGRNLWMKTDYTGYDPEVSQFGNVAIGRSVDTIPYPSARTIFFNISFGL